MTILLKSFGLGNKDASADVNKHGGKGAGLIQMSNMELPVPPGVIIPCDVCTDYHNSMVAEKDIQEVVKNIKKRLAPITKDGVFPLVSVRSGARVSMPGMMDTILNVGITTDNLPYWEDKMGKKAANDCFCRMLCMVGETAYGVGKKWLSEKYHAMKETDNLEAIKCELMVSLNFHGVPEFWDSVPIQLYSSIEAVWESWNSERAIEYRNIHGYDHSWGTAVVIQQMVFGNMDDQSCSGVVFSRNPDTGYADIVGDYLVNAQGEDVVSGISNPEPIDNMVNWDKDVADELVHYVLALEDHYKDMVDVEFTVESGKLYILQARVGKRSSVAAVKIAYELWLQGTITPEELPKYLKYSDYVNVIKSGVDYKEAPEPDYTGIPASYGAVTGLLTTDIDLVIANPGKYVLVRNETTPDDLKGMVASVGLITRYGGATSHAAVVARGLGVPCIVGCVDLAIKDGNILQSLDGQAIKLITSGVDVTMDGAKGNIWFGQTIPMIDSNNETVDKLVDILLDDVRREAFEYSKNITEKVPELVHVQYDLKALDEVLDKADNKGGTTIIIGTHLSGLGEPYHYLMSMMSEAVIKPEELKEVLVKHSKKASNITIYPLNMPWWTYEMFILRGYKLVQPCKKIEEITQHLGKSKVTLELDYLSEPDVAAIRKLLKLAGVEEVNTVALRSRATAIKEKLS